LRIEVLNRQRRFGVATAPLVRFLRRLAQAAPVAGPASVTVCLVSDRVMRDLNRRWRNAVGTTDVLSFPGGGREGPDGEVHLGDIVISVEQAERQARRSTPRELKVLILHGWLHLLGHDHEKDDGHMMRLQRRLERKLLSPGRRSK
jgi:probable rRNA maturation factor